MRSLKEQALKWIILQCEQCFLNDPEKALMDYPVYFKLDGFADEPHVYIKVNKDGLEFGYEAYQWDGPLHAPYLVLHKKNSLPWDGLDSLGKDDQHELINSILLKTIQSRKRQYRKCQFCAKKISVENRFDRDTCHGCATEHLGVLY